MLGGFEGEEGDAPGEGVNEFGVRADDVEGAADGAAGVEVGEDGGRVVCGGFVVEDGAGGFEELLIVSEDVHGEDGVDLHSARLVESACSCRPPR